MKKALLVAVLLSTTSSMVMAASNNIITFKGEVTAQTCSVSVNGTTANPVVLLPTVSSTDLSASGKSAGKTSFTLGVSGCAADNTKDTAIKTVFIGNNVSTAGNLKNTGTAGNVELQLLKSMSDTTGINLNTSSEQSGLVLLKGKTEAQHDYAVQYYATGAATAGTVITSVQYSVSYQ